jgi:hypothetical protein
MGRFRLSGMIRQRSFSPSQAASRQGTSASAFCRSTIVLGAAFPHCSFGPRNRDRPGDRRSSRRSSCGRRCDRTHRAPSCGTARRGTVKLTEPRARGDEVWSIWASGDGACVGDFAPDSKAVVTRSAAGCSRCRFWIRDVKEVRDLIVNRQKPLRLPG